MAHVRDYQGSTVGQAGCTYSQLGNVYAGQMAGQITQQDVYVVPQLCQNGAGPNYPPKYNTLSHGQQYQCGGYFNVKGAYPYSDCTSCNVNYVKRGCKDNVNCSAPSVVEGYRIKGRTRGLW